LTANLDTISLLKELKLSLPLLAVKGYSTLFSDMSFDMGNQALIFTDKQHFFIPKAAN